MPRSPAVARSPAGWCWAGRCSARARAPAGRSRPRPRYGSGSRSVCRPASRRAGSARRRWSRSRSAGPTQPAGPAPDLTRSAAARAPRARRLSPADPPTRHPGEQQRHQHRHGGEQHDDQPGQHGGPGCAAAPVRPANRGPGLHRPPPGRDEYRRDLGATLRNRPTGPTGPHWPSTADGPYWPGRDATSGPRCQLPDGARPKSAGSPPSITRSSVRSGFSWSNSAYVIAGMLSPASWIGSTTRGRTARR